MRSIAWAGEQMQIQHGFSSSRFHQLARTANMQICFEQEAMANPAAGAIGLGKLRH